MRPGLLSYFRITFKESYSSLIPWLSFVKSQLNAQGIQQVLFSLVGWNSNIFQHCASSRISIQLITHSYNSRFMRISWYMYTLVFKGSISHSLSISIFYTAPSSLVLFPSNTTFLAALNYNLSFI